MKFPGFLIFGVWSQFLARIRGIFSAITNDSGAIRIVNAFAVCFVLNFVCNVGHLILSRVANTSVFERENSSKSDRI